MARVLRYDEIFQPTPVQEVFNDALTSMRDGMQALHDQDLIKGAVFFGSSVGGDPTPQSDIDALVSTNEHTAELIGGVRAITRDLFLRTGIPVDCNVYDLDELTGGRHYYQASIIDALRKQVAGVKGSTVGQNPLDIIQPPRADQRVQVSSYLLAHKQELARYYTNGTTEHPEQTLGTILNIPHRLGRLCVSTLELYEYLPAGTLASIKKADIREAVLSTLAKNNEDLTEAYESITDDFLRYGTFVQEVRQKELTRDEYELALVATLEDNLPKAVVLAHEMHREFRAALLVEPTIP